MSLFKAPPAPTADANSGPNDDKGYVGKVRGHRVLFVHPSPEAPAVRAGFVPYLDIITHVGAQQLDEGANSLAKCVVGWIDQDVDVTVFNIRTKSTRVVMLNPNRNWGGPGVLGLVARWVLSHRFDVFTYTHIVLVL